MKKVSFKHRCGRVEVMQERFAQILAKMGKGRYQPREEPVKQKPEEKPEEKAETPKKRESKKREYKRRDLKAGE